MSTAPFLPSAESLITESHRQVVRARATHPSFSAPIDLDLKDVSLSWDEKRAPRVQGSLTCAVPQTAAEIDLLDPRAGVRVEVEVGYGMPSGAEDVWTIADLGLRQRTVSRPDDEMLLECSGDEALVIDGSPAASSSVSETTHSAAIATLVKQVVSPYPEFVVSITGGAAAVDPITDRWQTIQDLADRLDAKVYDDGLRTWYIEPTATLVASPVLTLKVGENGTLLDNDDVLTRDEWFNYVWLRYEWTDISNVQQRIDATAFVDSGTYSVTGPAGKRIFEDRREVPTTQAAANVAAQAVLDRQLSRGYTYRLSAIAAYWLRPGDTISVTLPHREAALHLVSSVTFRPKTGTMDLTTRLPLPEEVTPATTTPTVGSKTPDPAPPAVQTYTTTWTANSSQTYKSGGSKNTFGTDMIQGYYDGTNGNQQAIAIFTGTATSGSHSGQTISTALSGATVSKVEVYLYANHWYYNAGGTARIGKYAGSSIPTTYSGASPYVTVSGWQAGSGRWVTITSSALITELLSGLCRGITVGPGVGTDRTYYGKFNGAAASSGKPQLRITYSK